MAKTRGASTPTTKPTSAPTSGALAGTLSTAPVPCLRPPYHPKATSRPHPSAACSNHSSVRGRLCCTAAANPTPTPAPTSTSKGKGKGTRASTSRDAATPAFAPHRAVGSALMALQSGPVTSHPSSAMLLAAQARFRWPTTFRRVSPTCLLMR